MHAARLLCLLAGFAHIAAPDGPLTLRRDAVAASTRLRANTQLVLINASIYDRDGRLVPDVVPEQLRLFDEGVERRIASFSLEDVPVSLAVVLDVSRSMRSTLPAIREALARLSEAAKPEDEFLLITIRDAPAVAVPFTRDISLLESSILAQHAEGGTALYDALVLAFEKVKTGRNSRRAILVFSDGEDTKSRYTWGELQHRARESTTPVYAFVLAGAGEDAIIDGIRLERLAEDTGGRRIMVRRPRDFVERMESLDVHRQYLIGFAPATAANDGKYRRVQLRLTDESRRLRLYWRRGYHAPFR